MYNLTLLLLFLTLTVSQPINDNPACDTHNNVTDCLDYCICTWCSLTGVNYSCVDSYKCNVNCSIPDVTCLTNITNVTNIKISGAGEWSIRDGTCHKLLEVVRVLIIICSIGSAVSLCFLCCYNLCCDNKYSRYSSIN